MLPRATVNHHHNYNADRQPITGKPTAPNQPSGIGRNNNKRPSMVQRVAVPSINFKERAPEPGFRAPSPHNQKENERPTKQGAGRHRSNSVDAGRRGSVDAAGRPGDAPTGSSTERNDRAPPLPRQRNSVSSAAHAGLQLASPRDPWKVAMDNVRSMEAKLKESEAQWAKERKMYQQQLRELEQGMRDKDDEISVLKKKVSQPTTNPLEKRLMELKAELGRSREERKKDQEQLDDRQRRIEALQAELLAEKAGAKEGERKLAAAEKEARTADEKRGHAQAELDTTSAALRSSQAENDLLRAELAKGGGDHQKVADELAVAKKRAETLAGQLKTHLLLSVKVTKLTQQLAEAEAKLAAQAKKADAGEDKTKAENTRLKSELERSKSLVAKLRLELELAQSNTGDVEKLQAQLKAAAGRQAVDARTLEAQKLQLQEARRRVAALEANLEENASDAAIARAHAQLAEMKDRIGTEKAAAANLKQELVRAKNGDAEMKKTLMALQEQVARLEDQLRALQARLLELQGMLDGATAAKADALKEAAKAAAQAAQALAELAGLNAKLEVARQQACKAEASVVRLLGEIKGAETRAQAAEHKAAEAAKALRQAEVAHAEKVGRVEVQLAAQQAATARECALKEEGLKREKALEEKVAKAQAATERAHSELDACAAALRKALAELDLLRAELAKGGGDHQKVADELAVAKKRAETLAGELQKHLMMAAKVTKLKQALEEAELKLAAQAKAFAAERARLEKARDDKGAELARMRAEMDVAAVRSKASAAERRSSDASTDVRAAAAAAKMAAAERGAKELSRLVAGLLLAVKEEVKAKQGVINVEGLLKTAAVNDLKIGMESADFKVASALKENSVLVYGAQALESQLTKHDKQVAAKLQDSRERQLKKLKTDLDDECKKLVSVTASDGEAAEKHARRGHLPPLPGRASSGGVVCALLSSRQPPH
jgi:chromosome segregation ATPase